MLRRVEDFIFPPLCIICDSVRTNENRWLCKNCFQKLESAIKNRKMCERCGQNLNIYSCSCESFWDYPFTRIISFVDYKDVIRDIVHQIKYSGKKRLAFYMGEICSTYLTINLEKLNFDLAIPIPLHPLRLCQRGFNQAEWFAKGLL
ncbi:MAG: double zinc ribbon domain-containing protein, partial [Chitinispirillaceae bacterium]|nr:double zinc ribbon domain-containing protein [Chitinispirillaceae bacterium]